MKIGVHVGQAANPDLQGRASVHNLVHDGPGFCFVLFSFFHFHRKLMICHLNLRCHMGVVFYPGGSRVRRTSALW